METKYIFVTGGVLSGLGKGVSAASLGNLLKNSGFSVFVQKLDPYYNTDPGTMSPYQHGEVYVTKDGAETDLDIGHYERFIGEKFTKNSSYTQGSILFELLNEERQGKFDGNTVQVVPHVTDKIIEKIKKAGKTSKANFIITEVGGTVGDIESQPFIYAISQFIRMNEKKSMLIHTTYVPFLSASNEFKSKPTQQSISLLQSNGLRPNIILLRGNKEPEAFIVKKIAITSFLNEKFVIPVPNVSNIYKIPNYFAKYKMSEMVLNYFGMKTQKPDLTKWNKFIKLIDAEKKGEIKIAMVGKYAQFPEAYKSIVEAVKVSAINQMFDVSFKWIKSDGISEKNIKSKISGTDGTIILPGFGARGFSGKVIVAEYNRDKDIPTFGICYGFQAMVIAEARRQGIDDATSSEVSDEGTFVIDIIKGKDGNIGGTLRLGESTTLHIRGSLISKLYTSDQSIERHRHRYEANPRYLMQIQNNEFKFTGFDKKQNLAEVVEMPKKKFYLGVQAHPEFSSTPMFEHPLFRGFIKAVIKNKKNG
ncbi:CTP synthase [Candidatus Mycoplasma mahonii]|uniref:CTP synthase n=1 Tax=Candidatus Mycoplasma mahonii TaxID=3004105 RepID=UPI0026EEACFA|nr:CTP synthase [Candidatus Mycoplasma mahonii]WKX02611.1 CTP synthase [Candidatus Mycoplasma mahonii]